MILQLMLHKSGKKQLRLAFYPTAYHRYDKMVQDFFHQLYTHDDDLGKMFVCVNIDIYIIYLYM